MTNDGCDTLRAERAALRKALAFFASVIKSGEPWTEVCEKTYRAAMADPATLDH